MLDIQRRNENELTEEEKNECKNDKDLCGLDGEHWQWQQANRKTKFNKTNNNFSHIKNQDWNQS